MNTRTNTRNAKQGKAVSTNDRVSSPVGIIHGGKHATLRWHEFKERVPLSPNSQAYKDLQAILDSIPSHPESTRKSKMSDDYVTDNTRLSSNPKTLGQLWPDIRTLPDYIPKRAPAILLVAYLNSYAPGTFVHLVRCTTAAQDDIKDSHRSNLTNCRNRVTTYYWANDCSGREQPDRKGNYLGGARNNRKKGDNRYRGVDLACALDISTHQTMKENYLTRPTVVSQRISCFLKVKIDRYSFTCTRGIWYLTFMKASPSAAMVCSGSTQKYKVPSSSCFALRTMMSLVLASAARSKVFVVWGDGLHPVDCLILLNRA